MLLHASPSSCCSSWSSSFSSCSSYANLAGTRDAKNLEQNTSQLEKNETYLVHWSALPPTCLSWNFKTKKWTHVHWIYVSCLFPQLLHTWSTRRDLWVWLQCWLLLHQRMRNGPPDDDISDRKGPPIMILWVPTPPPWSISRPAKCHSQVRGESWGEVEYVTVSSIWHGTGEKENKLWKVAGE